MKKIFILLLMLSVQPLLACDICGCSSGNYFLGPTPLFSRHFAGIRYSFRSYHTELKSDDSQFSKDFYQTTELWGGFKIKNNFQLLAFLPFNINHSNTDDGIRNSHGFGDMTVIGNYNLLNKKSLNKDTLTVGQQLWFGVGLKIPTGKFEVDESEIVSSSNAQAGSGSLDFLLTGTYSLIIDDWGLSSNVNYKINQTASDFRFGNRFTASVFGFRSFPKNNHTLSPNIGLIYENLNPNQLDKIKIADTGGNALLASIGLETRFEKVTIGFNAQLPLSSNLSNGQTHINARGMVHVTYTF
jgi:hypothetical protein